MRYDIGGVCPDGVVEYHLYIISDGFCVSPDARFSDTGEVGLNMREETEIRDVYTIAYGRFMLLDAHASHIERIKAKCVLCVLNYTLGIISLDELNERLTDMK